MDILIPIAIGIHSVLPTLRVRLVGGIGEEGAKLAPSSVLLTLAQNALRPRGGEDDVGGNCNLCHDELLYPWLVCDTIVRLRIERVNMIFESSQFPHKHTDVRFELKIVFKFPFSYKV